ncbi:RodZ family helix-turn-helix domain-containing protein [Micromonospora chersina]|uniref:hypothetical protein n=1 Tax=Micromonospora chersina TaxID=47854 RepID=UPI0036C41013
MAERSTARPADGAARRDDPSDIDGWVTQLSQAGASDFDSDVERPEAAPPPWPEDLPDPYEESLQPEDTNRLHEGRHARHQRDEDEYEQYDGADSPHTDAYQQPAPLIYPEPGHYEPDQTFQYDQHEQVPGQEQADRPPYRHIEAGPVRENAYGALQDTYVLPEMGYAHEGQYPYDDYASPDEHRREEPVVQDSEAVADGRPRPIHHRESDPRPRPAGRRRWLIAVGGLALGVMLCALAVLWAVSDQPSENEVPLSTATNPPDASEQPLTLPATPSAASYSAAPPDSSPAPGRTRSGAPSATPSITPAATPSATASPIRPAPTPTQTRSAGPILLGPSSGDGVANMVQRYCDRRVAGSSAKPRNDGGWQCARLLVASAVDMDVACRDTYEADAYARTSDSRDPYAWRCYR